jgi:hypothetical protein
VREDQDPEI